MSLTHLTTVTASTKRPPAISGGKRGAPTAKLSSLSITPLDPLSMDTAQRMGIGSPVNYYECYAPGAPDVRAGDTLVVGSTEYPIRFVAAWEWPNRGTQTEYLHMVVEKVNP